MTDDLFSNLQHYFDWQSIVLTLLLAFFFFLVIDGWRRGFRKSRWRKRRRSDGSVENKTGNLVSLADRKARTEWEPGGTIRPDDMSDPANQMRAISQVRFERQRLLERA